MKNLISVMSLVAVAVLIAGCPGTKEPGPEAGIPPQMSQQGPPPGMPPGAPQDPKENMIYNLTGGLGRLEERLEKYRAEVGSDHPDIVRADSIVADAKAAIEALRPIPEGESLLMSAHRVNTRLFHIDQLLTEAGK